MDDRCRVSHAKLLSGTCPWCGRAIVNGRVKGAFEWLGDSTTSSTSVEIHDTASLQRMVLDTGPLDVRRAARYIAQVARELAALHDVASIHGSVNPANIFLNEKGAARLGSGGFSCIGDSADTGTYIEELAEASGVADYLAPEQAISLGNPDPRSDIYSLGCTLYFLLTGQAPFPQGTISERLLKHQTGTPESINQIRPDLPSELVRICEKMMAKKPSDRFQTALEVAEALRNF